jgi:hypothetical protein
MLEERPVECAAFMASLGLGHQGHVCIERLTVAGCAVRHGETKPPEMSAEPVTTAAAATSEPAATTASPMDSFSVPHVASTAAPPPATVAPETNAAAGAATAAPSVEYWNVPGATTADAGTSTAVTDAEYLNHAVPSSQTSKDEATLREAAAEPVTTTDDDDEPAATSELSASEDTTTETATAATYAEYSAPSDVDAISHALPFHECFDGICDNTKAVVAHLMSVNASTNAQCRAICATTPSCDFSSFCPLWDPDCLAEGTEGSCALYDGCQKNETHAWLVKDDGWNSCPKLAEPR